MGCDHQTKQDKWPFKQTNKKPKGMWAYLSFSSEYDPFPEQLPRFHIAVALSLAAKHTGCCKDELTIPGSEICFCLPSRRVDLSPKPRWSGVPTQLL